MTFFGANSTHRLGWKKDERWRMRESIFDTEVAGEDEGYPCRSALAMNEMMKLWQQTNCCICLVVTTLILAVVFEHTQQNLELQWKIPYMVALKVVDAIILNLMGLVSSFCVGLLERSTE